MPVIGFGGSAHDWAVAVVEDDGAVLSVEESRVTGLKYGLGADLLRSRARAACMAGREATAFDHAVACDLVPLPLAAPFRRRLHRVRHHEAHAWAAYLSSPFEDAAVCIVDNGGSPEGRGSPLGTHRRIETVSWFVGRGETLEPVQTFHGTHVLKASTLSEYQAPGETDDSLGHLYASVSRALGFVHGPGEGVTEDGKTMALAAMGSDRFVERLREVVDDRSGEGPGLRLADERFRRTVEAMAELDGAALARAAQTVLEEALVRLCSELRAVVDSPNLCLAGGVALNCVANSRIAAECGFDSIFVLPDAGDGGTALGSALYAHVALAGRPRPREMWERLPFLGPAPLASEVTAAAERCAAAGCSRAPAETAGVLDLIERGAVVAWFEGRSEWGPRALGHRSLLAGPWHAGMRDHVNRVVKRREAFRPFAPMVLTDAVEDFFRVSPNLGPTLPFMLCVGTVRPEHADELGSVLHVDGTARIQAVDRTRLPRVADLLEGLRRRGRPPVLLNTSFNVAGMPIVETPHDAVDCFMGTDIDALVLERELFVKPRAEAA